ncbi:BtpA/SgcQ family protein [Frondihabitans sp. 4ASC-45]|uniref:BtpA/SgcQ family protein n=1 Tax=Frondihabitans sp. 4ASC-45 TaxID=3111636 RepID=UPI003C22AD36
MSGFRLVGVLHLPPLPGAANYEGRPVAEIASAAADDARILEAAGFTDVMIQDASDEPQPTLVGAATVAALAVVGAAVRAATTIGLGVVVGHNDGPSGVAIAHAVGASFVRVKVLTGVSIGPTGWMEGCSLEVAHTKRLLGSDVEIWADLHEATSLALSGDLAWAAAQALDFGGADAVIVTRDSGVADAVADIAALRASGAVGADVPVYIGGRVNGSNLATAVGGSDGAILGSVLKDGDGYDARIDPTTATSLGDDARGHLA